MQAIKVTENLSVSPQITADDVALIKAEGFETIICNRPDDESLDQTPIEAIETAADAAGIKLIYQPIIGGTLNVNAANIFSKTLEESGKTFAYCRTGTRCITLWAIAQREAGNDPQEIFETCAQCGYDVSGALNNIF